MADYVAVTNRMKPFPTVFLLLLTAACCSCSPKKSEDELATTGPAEQPVGIPENGKVLYVSCSPCHGESGQGNPQMHAPSLTNLEDWYVYQQLINFQRGLRGYLPQDTLGLQMAAMSTALKDSIAISHVVAFIATLPPAALLNTVAGDVRKGERTYQSICGSCHGPQGKGNELMHAPRLNGLEDWYLKSQLLKFKQGIRGAHPQDHLGAQMISMAELLKDNQSMNDVVAYIRSVGETKAP